MWLMWYIIGFLVLVGFSIMFREYLRMKTFGNDILKLMVDITKNDNFDKQYLEFVRLSKVSLLGKIVDNLETVNKMMLDKYNIEPKIKMIDES